MKQPKWVKPLGRTVEQLMRDRLWTQDELAARSGVAQKTISNVIAGNRPNGPSPSTIRQVMAAFDEDGVRALRDLGHAGWAEAVQAEIDTRRELEAFRQLKREGTLKRLLEDEN